MACAGSACVHVLVAVEMPCSSMFSAAAGAAELLRGWKAAQRIALLALSSVAERGVCYGALALRLLALIH